MKTHTPSLHNSPNFNFDIIPKIEGAIRRSYIVDDLFWIMDTLRKCMQEGGGAKDTAPDSGGGEGGHIQGLQHVWMPRGDCDLSQILGAGDLSGGR